MVFQLHAMTNGKLELEQASYTAAVIHSLVDIIHIREKHRSAKELFNWVKTFKEVGVPSEKIVVNDRVDVAMAAGAGGVQLTENSLSLKDMRMITESLKAGCSIHEPHAAVKMAKERADWVLFGHVYETSSKLGKKPAGLDQLKAAADSSNVPVIAIGGITPCRIQEVKKAGAGGIAVMSGIFGSGDPAAAAAGYRSEINKMKKESHSDG